MLRILLFCILLLISVVVPTWLLAVIALVYALRYTAYELIPLALCIDAYYGMSFYGHLPYYTLCAILLLIVVEYIKPRLSLYNEVS